MQRPGRREVLIAGSSLLAGCSGLSAGSSSDGDGSGDDASGGNESTDGSSDGNGSTGDSSGGNGSASGERYPSWQYDWGNSGEADGVTAPDGRPSLGWDREIGPGNGGASPVVADGTVFVGNGGDTFYAVDAATGETNWTAETGKWIHSTAAVDGDFLAFGCDDFHVRAFHLDGTERWTYAAAFEISSDPVLTDELVVVTDTDGVVYAIDRASGEDVWTRTLETGTLGYLSSPVLGADRLYVGNQTATWALSLADGSTVWRTDDDRPVGGSHAVADGRVVGVSAAGFGRDDGVVYALDAASGAVQWFHELDQEYPSDAAIAGDRVYLSDPDGLAARSVADGSVDWRVSLGGASGAPVVADGTVFCGSASGVHAVDMDGSVRWQTDAAAGDSGVAIASGRLFMKHDRQLFALE